MFEDDPTPPAGGDDTPSGEAAAGGDDAPSGEAAAGDDTPSGEKTE